MGAIYGTYFGLAAREHALSSDEKGRFLASGILLTSLSLGVGLYRLVHVPERERTYERFRADMSRPDADQARVAAAIETRLQEIQEEEHNTRRRKLVVGYLAATFASGAAVLNEFTKQSQDSRILERGFAIGVAGIVLSLTLREQFSTSATDKFIELWRKDPRHRPLDLTLAPLAGGGMFALTGSF